MVNIKKTPWIIYTDRSVIPIQRYVYHVKHVLCVNGMNGTHLVVANKNRCFTDKTSAYKILQLDPRTDFFATQREAEFEIIRRERFVI